MADQNVIHSPAGEFIMFASDDGTVRITCRFEHETLWLSQAAIAALYQVTPQAITQHIKAIYEEGELEQKATCKAYLQVQQEGAGKISKKAADEKACSEYIEYEKKQRLLKEAEGGERYCRLIKMG